jgi:hypothetical protein
MSAITVPAADAPVPAAIQPNQLTLVRRLHGPSARGRLMLQFAFAGERMPVDLGLLLLTVTAVFLEQGIARDAYSSETLIYIVAGVLNVDVIFNDDTTFDSLPDLEILIRRLCQEQIAAEAA